MFYYSNYLPDFGIIHLKKTITINEGEMAEFIQKNKLKLDKRECVGGHLMVHKSVKQNTISIYLPVFYGD